MEKQTVAVTGGCGFLGQHLIKLLHTNTTNVQCVRVLDFMAFNSELGPYTPSLAVSGTLHTVGLDTRYYFTAAAGLPVFIPAFFVSFLRH